MSDAAREAYNQAIEEAAVLQLRRLIRQAREREMAHEKESPGEVRFRVELHVFDPRSRSRNAVPTRFPAYGYLAVSVRTISGDEKVKP